MASLNFVLTGDDRLSRILDRAGDNASRLARRIDRAAADGSTSMARLTRDSNGRLRDLQGRFVSVGDAMRSVQGELPGLSRRLGEVTSAGSSAAASMGSSGGGLSGAMMGVGAAAGLSLLPALGALVPMLAGGALAAGTLKLGFAGVSDTMAASGKGKKEYAEALKKLSPETRSFTKELVGMKKEFSGVGKDVQKAMLPGFTRALKDAEPVVKIVGKSMTEMGGAFGDAARGAGRMMKDSGFQGALQTNLKLGSGAIRDITGSLGPFTRSLLDFGAASGPTVKSITDGLSGLLGKGLPAMFDGLKTGIPGTSKMLDGLFSAVNDIVGGIGRLGGEAGRVLGPLFGETFAVGGDLAAGAMDGLRGALHLLQPVFRDVTFGLKTIRDVGAIVGPTLKDTALGIAGAFLPIGDSVNNAVGPLQRLNRWVADNKIGILEAARVFGIGMLDITGAAINAAPPVIHAFRFISQAFLDSVGVVVGGAAKLFGWLPGIGPKLKKASSEFDSFKGTYLAGLDAAEHKANEFAASSGPKLSGSKLKLDINNWSAQLAEAKRKLATVPPSKQAALKATIRDLEAKVAAAKAKLNGIDGKTATTWIYTNVQTNYVPSATRKGSLHDALAGGGQVRGYAGGGGIQYFPNGGYVSGPGSSRSDSIFALLASGARARVSDTEFVVQSAAVRKYGLPFLNALNAGRLADGGATAAGVSVGAGLASGMASSSRSVGSAARLMAAAITAGIRDEMEIRSPSKKTAALAKDIGKGLIVGMLGTRDKIKATAADLSTDIKTAFSGRKESGLLRMVDQQTKKLLDLAAQRDKVGAKIAAAKEYASSVTSTARDGASLANLGLEPEQVSAGTIKAGLGSKLAQIKQFTRYIDILAKRGLGKGLLRQILNMGPEAGYAYASALVGADKGTVKQINALQSQIDSSTTALGKSGADKLYDSGKNASKGFLTGLLSQEKSLEATMERLAKSMQKALRKALGIKSPARAMIPDGVMTTRGVAVGLLEGMPHVDRAMQTVAGRMAGHAAVTPVPGRAAVTRGGTGGGGGVMNVFVTVQVAPTADRLAIGKEIQQTLLHLKRNQGYGELGIA
ncbi:chorismate mutase [Streptomyces sp. SAI-144]|uniref:hypothetical protein n=1 Tax=Streptomyces sp. SAI-144 TaxID=2940544 RepID=UPI0024734432|nr:hypothetical protein [Streptomyces sp. SAI-144]MDH6432610.1 chorismate mutase [Streptomyces sp. SAI-144]